MDFFKEKEYSQEVFKNVICEHESLRALSFTDCEFIACRFDQVDFSGAVFSDCSFDHCELNLPKLIDSGLKGVKFQACKLVGADFTKCDPALLGFAFQDCLIDTCNFSALKLKQTSFVNCLVRETRFVETVLSKADFGGSDLEGTIFHQCDLEKANFLHARNYSIDPTANNLKGAIFALPEAITLLTRLGIDLR